MYKRVSRSGKFLPCATFAHPSSLRDEVEVDFESSLCALDTGGEESLVSGPSFSFGRHLGFGFVFLSIVLSLRWKINAGRVVEELWISYCNLQLMRQC